MGTIRLPLNRTAATPASAPAQQQLPQPGLEPLENPEADTPAPDPAVAPAPPPPAATPPAAAAPAATSPPAKPATPPRRTAPPLAGTRPQDEDDEIVPPEPVTPNGTYLARVTRIQQWLKDGEPQLNEDGSKRPRTLFFEIDDPAQLKLAVAGQPSCQGYEVNLDLVFTGFRADQVNKFLSALGAPRSTWPKGKAGGACSISQLCEHVMTVTKNRKFKIRTEAEAGKGKYKDRVFCRLREVTAVAPPPARPATTPPAGPPRSAPPSTDGTGGEA